MYSDVVYKGNNDTQKSVAGYTIQVNGVIVTWNLRIQKNVTLLDIKAEYSGLVPDNTVHSGQNCYQLIKKNPVSD